MANISKQLICEVRRYLRISHTHLDAEITDLIEAAQADVGVGGIKAARVEDGKDARIKRAVGGYVRAEVGLDNGGAEKYRNSYEMLKRHLQLSSEYIEEA